MGGNGDDDAQEQPQAEAPACEQCEDTGVYDAGDAEFGEDWRLCDCAVVPPTEESE